MKIRVSTIWLSTLASPARNQRRRVPSLPFSAEKSMQQLHPFPGMTISACQLRPESRGTVTLASPDPRQKALIHANYLAAETDRRCMVEGIKLGRRLAQAKAFAGIVEEEVVPGAAAASDEEVLGFIRRTGNTIYHPSGTCRMSGGTCRTTSRRGSPSGCAARAASTPASAACSAAR